jgi:hypothetical protein
VRRGWAVAAALVGACGPPVVATAPGPSAALSVSGAPGGSAAPEGPASAPGSAASSSGLAAGMKPHTGAWLESDALQVFPEHALMISPGHLRLRRDEPLRLEGGYDPVIRPMEVAVVAHDGESSRIVFETREVRLLFWATEQAFEPVPVRPQRLALKPGQYPKGPVEMAARDELGVWVMPGWYETPLERRDGWRQVSVNDMSIKVKGWLDESQFGAFFRRLSRDNSRTRGGVMGGARLLASPTGPVLMTLPLEPGGSWTGAFEDVGPAVPGFVHVRYAGRESVIQALVRTAEFTSSISSSFSSSGRVSMRRGVRGMPPRLQVLEAGTLLYDGPGGEPIGRILRSMEIPDRADPTVDRGLRRVEVPLSELGLLPAWVEATALKPLPAPPASASASGSASAGIR